MAYRSSSASTNGATTSPATINVAVPTGVQIGDIVLLIAALDSVSITPTWPTGFTQLTNTTITTPDGEVLAVAWKRLTAVDSGNYAFTTNTTGNENDVFAVAFSGRDGANPPVISTVATSTTGNTMPVTATANAVTALAGDDICCIAVWDPIAGATGTDTYTPPSGFTSRQNGNKTFGWSPTLISTQDNVVAGTTGTKASVWTNTTTTTAGWLAVLIRIPASTDPFPVAYKPWLQRSPPNMRSLLVR